MEDHVGWLLRALASLATAAGSAAAFVRSLAVLPESEHWAALALLLGCLAVLVAREARTRAPQAAFLGGVVGGLVVAALVAQSLCLIGGAFLEAGPDLIP